MLSFVKKMAVRIFVSKNQSSVKEIVGKKNSRQKNWSLAKKFVTFCQLFSDKV